MPGTYNETITIPSNIIVRGQNLQSVVIQKTGITGSSGTTGASVYSVVTMGQNTRLEDVTVTASTTGNVNISAVNFPNGSAIT